MSEENELPREWVWTTLSDVSLIQSGLGFPEVLQGKTNGDLPFVKVADISTAVLNMNGTLTSASNYLSFAEAQTLRAKVFPVGTTLFAKIGEAIRLNRRAIAEVAVLADNNVMGLVPEEGLTAPKYLFYFMYIVDLYNYTQATTVPSVRKSDVEQIKMPLSPLLEQYRIVAAIEQQFTRLDAGVAALQRAKAKLKRYRAAVLKAAVEGKLTEAWRAEHPTTEPASMLLERILEERRAKWVADLRAKGKDPAKARYVEPAKPDVESLPELPEGWCWATLESIASIQLGKMLSPKAYESGLTQLPYLRNENVRWGSIDYNDVKKMGFKDYELEKYRLEPGDLLVCEGGEAGRCAIYTGNAGQYMYQKALHRVRVVDNVAKPHFIQFCIHHYVASKTIIPKPSETTIQHLPLEKIQVLPFPLPSLTEQEQIVAEVERRLSVISQLEATVDADLKRAERLRQSILSEAFAGRLVLQDPNDEPASVLLERIRSERDKRKSGTNKNGRSMRVSEPVTLDVIGAEQVELWENVGN